MKIEEKNYIIENPDNIESYYHLYQAEIWGNTTNINRAGFISNIFENKESLNHIYEDIPILVYKDKDDDEIHELITNRLCMQTDDLSSLYASSLSYFVFYKHLIKLTGEQIKKYAKLINSLTKDEIEKYKKTIYDIAVNNDEYIENINKTEDELILKFNKK